MPGQGQDQAQSCSKKKRGRTDWVGAKGLKPEGERPETGHKLVCGQLGLVQGGKMTRTGQRPGPGQSQGQGAKLVRAEGQVQGGPGPGPGLSTTLSYTLLRSTLYSRPRARARARGRGRGRGQGQGAMGPEGARARPGLEGKPSLKTSSVARLGLPRRVSLSARRAPAYPKTQESGVAGGFRV